MVGSREKGMLSVGTQFVSIFFSRYSIQDLDPWDVLRTSKVCPPPSAQPLWEPSPDVPRAVPLWSAMRASEHVCGGVGHRALLLTSFSV